MFLNRLSDELKWEEEQSKDNVLRRNIVTELFEGTTQTKITCLKCSDQKKMNQSFFTLSLSLPPNEYDYYKVLIFPHSFEERQPLTKIGFRLKKNCSVVHN